MEKISWTDRVRNEEVSHKSRVKKKRNILQTIKEGKLTGFVASCLGVPSKAHYCRKDIRKK
jgi:hypothetical protein